MTLNFLIKHYLKLFQYLLVWRSYPEDWNKWISNKLNPSNITENDKIIFVCDGYKNHGGLADRIRGIITTYKLTKSYNKDFFIYWNDPFKLEDFLVPADYNWRLENKYSEYIYNNAFPVIIESNKENWKNFIKNLIFKYNIYRKGKKLIYTNLNYHKKNISSLFIELFKPSAYLQGFLDEEFKKISSAYYSYTFRFGNTFGDFNDNIPVIKDEDFKRSLLEKIFIEFKFLIENQPREFNILVTSDSIFFLKIIKKMFPIIHTVEIELQHLDYHSKNEIDKVIWGKSFIDLYMIMNSERVYLMLTHGMYESGFPKLAAKLGNKKYIVHKF